MPTPTAVPVASAHRRHRSAAVRARATSFAPKEDATRLCAAIANASSANSVTHHTWTQIWCGAAAPAPAASAVALRRTACKMSVRTSCEADPAARGFNAPNQPAMDASGDPMRFVVPVPVVRSVVVVLPIPPIRVIPLIPGSNPSSTSIFQNTTAAIHSAVVVAAAAPATPNAGTGPKPKINTGSIAKFTAFAAPDTSSGVLVSSKPLYAPTATVPINAAGADKARTRRYASA
mmetsp:Transcript_1708/g.6478  ORF Transcript_1708/g.6478 Transcript_1708/m.6478 type:complete len:233 (+) Transcript_1708:410-1108(+)